MMMTATVSELVQSVSPLPGAHQVRVGPLQRHRSRVAAQDAHHARGQLLDPRQDRTHGGSRCTASYGAEQQHHTTPHTDTRNFII